MLFDVKSLTHPHRLELTVMRSFRQKIRAGFIASL